MSDKEKKDNTPIKPQDTGHEKPITMNSYSLYSKSDSDEFVSGLLQGPGKNRSGKEECDPNAIHSNALEFEDSFHDLYETSSGTDVALIEPPFNPQTLQKLVKHNNALGPCIEAMRINIDGTGFEVFKKLKPEDKGEREEHLHDKNLETLNEFFDEPWPGLSFTKLRKDLREDLETIGYGFLEVIRNPKGDIVFLRYIEAKTMRLLKLDGCKTVVREINRRGSIRKTTVNLRFRRFAQQIGTRVIYYKEFQADPDLDKTTGKWAPKGEMFSFQKRGSEIIYFVLDKDINSPYGVPRWISQLPSILGSRRAEENNLDFFNSGGIPPFILIVQGGILAPATKEAIEKGLATNNASKQRGLVIEVHSSGGSINDTNNVKVHVEKFGAEKQKDSQFEVYDSKCEARVRASFRLPPIFVGRTDDYNFACYDEETETLTDQGWIKYNEFKAGMRIACYNKDTESLEYHEPTDKLPRVYDVHGVEMYKFKTQNIDILVTPNHNMLYKTQNDKLRLESVEEMLSRCTRPKFVARVKNNDEGWYMETFTPPQSFYEHAHHLNKKPITLKADIFLKFMGWYLSEGHALKQGSAINIYQHEDRHWDEINDLISSMESLGYKIWRYNKLGKVKSITIHDKNLYEWVVGNSGDIGYKKYIPQIIKDLNRRQLKVFFDAIMKGGGSVDHREGISNFSYATTSKRLADDIQEIAIKLGFKAYIRKEKPGTCGIRPVYVVGMSIKGKAGGSGETFSCHIESALTRVQYTGKVYCFEVPTGVFITRRNGKVAIQGNSAFASYMVGEAQVFKPERDEFDELMTLRLIPSLLKGTKDTYKFRSLPIVVNDAKEKIMSVKLSADKKAISPEEMIRQLNEITGLEMRVAEGAEFIADTLDDDNEGITSDSELTDASTSDPNEAQDTQDKKK